MDSARGGQLSAPPSLERVNSSGGPDIFNAAGRFVSLGHIDTEALKVFITRHAHGEFCVVEIEVGTVGPNFEFMHVIGKTRRLSPWEWSYLLLAFQGSWCSPCVAQFHYLKRA